MGRSFNLATREKFAAMVCVMLVLAGVVGVMLWLLQKAAWPH